MTPPTVTLVIPGRNCETTLDRCLQSVVPFLSVVDLVIDPSAATANETGSPHPASETAGLVSRFGASPGSDATEPGLAPQRLARHPQTTSNPRSHREGILKEIIFVNDGSTDSTAEIASRYPISVIEGTGQGPGAARNLGWQAAKTELIWFIDSDCVAEPDALEKLLPHIADPNVAGVGGSYANLFPESMVATLIHEEIVARHRRMPREVDFLATFNVIYRRRVLTEVSGFNEELKLAQDAELAYRIRAAGHQLNFELDSRVGHHHPRFLFRYLKTQARQGYYRVSLYCEHPTKISGDSYAGILDYAQPPLALAGLISLPLCVFGGRMYLISLICIILLVLIQLPFAFRVFPNFSLNFLARFLVFGTVRSFARGIGMFLGGVTALKGSFQRSAGRASTNSCDAVSLDSVGGSARD